MSFGFDEEVLELIKQLVAKVSDLEDGTPVFDYVFKYAVNTLQTADSMLFVTQTDIDRKILSLAEKFVFHGFVRQAGELRRLYDKCVTKCPNKDELKTRLTTMQLLFELSESPTNYLANIPEGSEPVIIPEEEEIDWGTYLQEGIERWSPPPDHSDSDEWSDDDTEQSNIYMDKSDCSRSYAACSNDDYSPSECEVPIDARKLQQNLYDSIQCHWFSNDYVCMLPESNEEQANFTIKWYDHLEKATHGLIEIERPIVVSEYKIIREIIWQLNEPFSGFVFKFSGDKLVVRDDVTIASVRPVAFKIFLQQFVKYIEMMQRLRDFASDACAVRGTTNTVAPGTYRSYCCAVKNILSLTMKELIEIESVTMKQDETMTLLILEDRCRSLFATAKILQDVQGKVILDYKTVDPLKCSTNLLTKLHEGVKYSYSKIEQDVYLTLYLETLFQYIRIIDNWLSNGSFIDDFEEFPIVNLNYTEAEQALVLDKSHLIPGEEERKLNFIVLELDKSVSDDGLLKLITNEVLQIGTNIHLLQMLRKLHLLKRRTTVSLHEELVEKVVSKLEDHFGVSRQATPTTENMAEGINQDGYRFPAICPDFCKVSTEMDRLENLIDTSDGFLMSAFESFFVEKPEVEEEPEVTLYERISSMTSHIFPMQSLIESTLSSILKERYGESGRLVKTILKTDYHLDRHMRLLNHVFLFKDDIIFSFYRRVFVKMEEGGKLGNNVWLTSHLQDILIDIYPDDYSNVTAAVKPEWQDYAKDSLMACALFNIHYKIEWPISIIISDDDMKKYKELFYFILKIKWALYTLNHMQFKEIELPGKRESQSTILRIFQSRLKVLRFGLIHTFSSIQHYFLGYVYDKYSKQFEEDFERSNELGTLIEAHRNFITGLHSTCVHVNEFKAKLFGFQLLLYLVRKLRLMWKNIRNIDEESLRSTEDNYRECQKYIAEIIVPVED